MYNNIKALSFHVSEQVLNEEKKKTNHKNKGGADEAQEKKLNDLVKNFLERSKPVW